MTQVSEQISESNQNSFTTFSYIRAVQRNILLNAQSILNFSKKDKDENENVPEGFKKFLKKTRRSASDKEASTSDKSDKKASKKDD